MGFWWEDKTTFREDKVVVKLYDNDVFIKSVIVPTNLYPLNDKYKVFTYKNTEPVTDEKILKIFDSVKYKIGHCYQNSEKLVSRLREENINAKCYCGWLFVGASQCPVHHCWVVVDDKHILDMGDDFTVMLSGQNGKNFKGANIKQSRFLVADFARATKNVPNSTRCAPVGTPTPFLLYVGSECEAEQGRLIYNRLIEQYPNHECERNCDKSGLNDTQRIMKQMDLM